ncbi:MAG: hypothetical protein HYX75_23475 [Acidobacteria bacterium]|nr:hypothetical protein [Acidobacteriota bacterium]
MALTVQAEEQHGVHGGHLPPWSAVDEAEGSEVGTGPSLRTGANGSEAYSEALGSINLPTSPPRRDLARCLGAPNALRFIREGAGE